MSRVAFLTATAFASGLLLGGGLVLSDMTTPANILAFLDVAGAWNPALALVMASAIAVAAPAFWLARRRQRTLPGAPAPLCRRRPVDRRPVDRRLVIGSLVFGVGWGLSGICPGPGLVLATSGSAGALVFVAAMATGMSLARRLAPADAGDPRAATRTGPETAADSCG